MPYEDQDIIKDIARQKLIKAVYSGKIKRPKSCDYCGDRCTPHGHHENYTRPLDVVWLCADCHTDIHRKFDGKNVFKTIADLADIARGY